MPSLRGSNFTFKGSAMSEHIDELSSINHNYRAALTAYQARTGLAPQTVDTRGSGEEKEKFARMDADMSATELLAQNAALSARLAKLESKPQFERQVSKKFGTNDSEEYAERYIHALARGDVQSLRAQASMGTDVGTAVPTDLERRIVEKMFQTNVLRQIAVVNTIDSKRTIAVEAALPTTTKVAETIGDPGTAVNATLSFPTMATAISVAFTKYVTPVKMSQEFIEDAIGTGGIGSGMEYVARKCAMSMSLKHEEQFTIGDGSGDPQGIALTGALTANVTNLGTAVALAAVTADNVIDTWHGCPVAYRNSPKFRWLVSDTFLKTVRKLKTTNGDYIFSPNNSGVGQNVVGLPGSIYGTPYSVGQYMPTATVEGAVYAVVGDFNYFEIFDRTGISSLLDPYSAALAGQTLLYVYSRTDSRIMLNEAFSAMTS